jgi:hypothetical protein
MATDACQFSYDCESCGTLLRPRSGDCWVFCSYGSVPCPPIQSPAANADPRAAQKGKTLIGADNVFKLAVATAIVLFGLNLGATLVTVAGVLVMLSVSLTRPRAGTSVARDGAVGASAILKKELSREHGERDQTSRARAICLCRRGQDELLRPEILW